MEEEEDDNGTVGVEGMREEGEETIARSELLITLCPTWTPTQMDKHRLNASAYHEQIHSMYSAETFLSGCIHLMEALRR